MSDDLEPMGKVIRLDQDDLGRPNRPQVYGVDCAVKTFRYSRYPDGKVNEVYGGPAIGQGY
jgi:hypothetical protein